MASERLRMPSGVVGMPSLPVGMPSHAIGSLSEAAGTLPERVGITSGPVRMAHRLRILGVYRGPVSHFFSFSCASRSEPHDPRSPAPTPIDPIPPHFSPQYIVALVALSRQGTLSIVDVSLFTLDLPHELKAPCDQSKEPSHGFRILIFGGKSHSQSIVWFHTGPRGRDAGFFSGSGKFRQRRKEVINYD